MTPLVWGFATLSKANTKPAENEDALGANAGADRFAVADGASEGWQSGVWSRHLVKAYLKRPPTPADFPAWMKLVREKWQPPAPSGPTSWYAEEKQSQGSFATLLGIHFTPGKAGSIAWKAVAVGDSCLLIVRNEELLTCWPVESLAGFSNTPSLLASAAAVKVPEPEWLAGRCEPGDLFVLATDAAAAGLLTLAGPKLWRSVRDIAARPGATERTAGLLELAKQCQRLRNDDVTLLAVLTPPLRESE